MYISKLSQYLTLTGLGILISAIPVTAATITFDLDFFDDGGTEVGDGQFSYDDEALTCVELSPVGDCFREPLEDPNDFNDVFFVENALTDFSATINGEDWDLGYITWWGDDESGQLPGYQAPSRYGISIAENSWFFGDGDFGERQLSIDITQSSDIYGEGSWEQNVIPPGGGNPFAGAGTWQATRVGTAPEPSVPASSEAIPEPSTVFSTLVAIIFGYFTKHKYTRINSSVSNRSI